MKLFLVSQNVNDNYDIYDAMVVAAETTEDARMIHPDGSVRSAAWEGIDDGPDHRWCDADHVEVKCIGTANKGTQAGVILTSYDRG